MAPPFTGHERVTCVPRPSCAGLGWMILAQLCFAAMNVCHPPRRRATSPGPRSPRRFLIGALIAVGLASSRGVSLRVTDREAPGGGRSTAPWPPSGAFYALASPSVARGRRGDARRHRADLRRPLLRKASLGERVGRRLWIVGRDGVRAASSCCCGRRSTARRAGRRGGHRGRLLLRPGDDLAASDRPGREPRGGGAALLPGRARHHAGARDPVSGRWPDARSGLYLLGAGLGRRRRAARHDPGLLPAPRRAGDGGLDSLGVVFT